MSCVFAAFHSLKPTAACSECTLVGNSLIRIIWGKWGLMYVFLIRGFITAPCQPPAQTVMQFHTESSLTAQISDESGWWWWRWRRWRFVQQTDFDHLRWGAQESFHRRQICGGMLRVTSKVWVYLCTSLSLKHTPPPRARGCVTTVCARRAGRSSPLLLLWSLEGGGGGGRVYRAARR